jgi:hypothetical protein
MGCPKCVEIPGFHHFSIIGETISGDNIYYSKPSIYTEKRLTEESITNYLIHLDNASAKPWVWIIDSRGLDNLETPNLLLLRKFYVEIKTRYTDIIKNIFILNESFMMKIIYNMIYPFLSSEIKKLVVFCPTTQALSKTSIDQLIIDKISDPK